MGNIVGDNRTTNIIPPHRIFTPLYRSWVPSNTPSIICLNFNCAPPGNAVPKCGMSELGLDPSLKGFDYFLSSVCGERL
ncbi:hypothetical protein VH15_11010, partial [Corynebacterium ulcerans]